MAVVTKYGNGYKDPAALRPVDAVFAEGVERKIVSQVAIANGDSINSLYYFGKVPSSALISPGSNLYIAAIAGVTDFSLGFAAAPKALMSSVDVHAGGTFPALSNVGITSYTSRAWQIAGLASDPGGMLDIFATLGAASTGAGAAILSMPFSKTA